MRGLHQKTLGFLEKYLYPEAIGSDVRPVAVFGRAEIFPPAEAGEGPFLLAAFHGAETGIFMRHAGLLEGFCLDDGIPRQESAFIGSLPAKVRPEVIIVRNRAEVAEWFERNGIPDEDPAIFGTTSGLLSGLSAVALKHQDNCVAKKPRIVFRDLYTACIEAEDGIDRLSLPFPSKRFLAASDRRAR